MPLGDGGRANVIVTDRSHGDLAIGASGVESRRRQIVDAPWTWLRQVHGRTVVEVRHPGDRAGSEADAAWTNGCDAPVAVQVADCAPVALLSPAGLVGVAHAGWRGLVSGVVEATIDAMRSAGGTELVAVLGPCIRPSAYEFGESALAQVEHRLGPTVRSTTDRGTPALDVPAAVEAALGQRRVPLVAVLGGCTAAEATRRWSHRARSDAERQAMVAWIDCSGEDGEP
mgnify:CR=1 FL=1